MSLNESKNLGSHSTVGVLLDRVLESGRLPPAYLFAGPQGAGKHATALAFSQRLLKTTKPNPPDLIWIAPEKNTLKIEQIRDLSHRVYFRPLEGDRMVCVIAEAEKMTANGANALLKILEEPPPYLLFILLSSAPDLLLPTIRSRCQKILFAPPTLVWQLAEDHQEAFERWQNELLPALLTTTPFAELSKQAETWAGEAPLLPTLMQWLRAWWHDLAAYQATGSEQGLLLREDLERIRATAPSRSPERVFSDFALIDETERALEANVQKTLALERLFMGLAG